MTSEWDLAHAEPAPERNPTTAKEAVDALDRMVNPDAAPLPFGWNVNLRCAEGKCNGASMFQDPTNANRFICTTCRGVLVIEVEKWPDHRPQKPKK